jgi:OOP family OmpA-OmpF porin
LLQYRRGKTGDVFFVNLMKKEGKTMVKKYMRVVLIAMMSAFLISCAGGTPFQKQPLVGNKCLCRTVKKAPPKKAPCKMPKDTDGDGVLDRADKCPKTPKGAKVNRQGCWVLKGIEFDTGKSTIKSQSTGVLDEVVAVLMKNPSLKVEVQGHTDNVGTQENNQALSQRRADAVMGYCVGKGIAKDRLSAMGYGFSKPIASNDTAEGRAKNRRVQLKPH